MEDLTKQQIVLVTLLVSFVTSIATGIITVSLVNQAPQTFTQTVNKVVERTIERVVPDASVIKSLEPKIITLEDQVASTAEIGLQSTVQILDQDKKISGIGFVFSKDGKVFTHIGSGIHTLVYANGSTYDAQIATSTGDISVIIPIIPADKIKTTKFIPLDLSDGKNTKPGKTVVLVSGEGRSVYTGIIQNIQASTSIITTSIPEKDVVQGSFILDLTGDVIGVKISSPENSFIPAYILKPLLK